MMARKQRTVSGAYRLGILSRVLAASLGGYALAALLSSVLALALPHVAGVSRANSVLTASLLSFVIYTVIALWVFCARTALRAWLGMMGLAAIAGVLLWYLRGGA